MTKIGSVRSGKTPLESTCLIDIDQNKETICTVTIKSKDQALVTAIEKSVVRSIN